MDAVILSAGRGTRMMPLTANTPKCLIEIGEGKTVLENQLDVLSMFDFERIFVVSGYRIEQIEAKIAGYGDKDMDIRVIHNPFFGTTNNIISLWLSLPFVGGDFVSINGDDVFKPTVIKELLKVDSEIVMVTNRKESYDQDDMKVIKNESRVIRVGKDLSGSGVNGESVGIIKFTGNGVAVLSKTLNQMLRIEDNHHVFYLAALQEIMDQGFLVDSCEIEAEDWAEIDFHPDVVDVRNKVDKFLQRMR